VASPDIVARTGWTTAELAAGIEIAKPQPPYDLVSLLIGVNNQYRGQSVERYRTELRSLLNQSITLAAGRADRVLVLSTPDWGVTPAALGRNRAEIAREIDLFNQVQREECDKLKIAVVDITPLSRQALNDPTQIASDNLHFSGKMYQKWAETALPVAKKLLEK
jgi:lysophospholipase L1-like esterase